MVRRLLPVALCLALAAGGCGRSAQAPRPDGAVRHGGSVTFLTAGDVDFLDPGLTFSTLGFAVQGAVNRTLYAYFPGFEDPLPDLADGRARVSEDGRTITVRIRRGVRYAPPVNREVRAGDIRHMVRSHEPDRRIELVRNPNWDADTDRRPARLDAIAFEEGNTDLTIAGRRALLGSAMLCCDTLQPPAAVIRAAAGRRGRIASAPSGMTLWLAFNTSRPPFDDADVRRAAIAGIDRRALLLSRGGGPHSALAQHFIPPGVPGFEESGGAAGFRDLDFMRRPEGDRRLAAAYFKRAGFRSGHYEGKEGVVLLVGAGGVDGDVAEVAQEELRRLGFDVRIRELNPAAVYGKLCGYRHAQYGMCSVGWAKDIDDAESVLRVPFTAMVGGAPNHINWSLLSGDLDRAIAAADVAGVMNPYTAMWDLSHTALRR